MSAIPSSMLETARPRIPEPSPALLALQQQGFELAKGGSGPVSPPCPDEILDLDRRISPLSFMSNSLVQGQPLTVETRARENSQSSSVGSADTTVTKILDLYINISDWSLKSEYEEITPYPDDSDNESGPSIPTVHQPKAYRDTIAPLLEHQFSESNLMVPLMNSPQLFTSLPRLPHPNANANVSITSLNLTLDTSNTPQGIATKPNISQTSIQITPDIAVAAPSFQQFSQDLAQRKIVLEVPDVRDADSWYDQALSPAITDANVHYRESYESITSTTSIDYERSMAYDMLAPPITKRSPNLGPVSVVKDRHSPDPSSAMIEEISHHRVAPSLLHLTASRPPSITAKIVRDANSPIKTTQAQAKDPMKRPSVALSSGSDDSYVIHDTLKGHLKAIWRHKFNKKEKDAQDMEQTNKIQTNFVRTNDIETNFIDDPESYKYPYNLQNLSNLSRTDISAREQTLHDTSGQISAATTVKSRTTDASRNTRRRSPQRAIPLTRYQKYGPEIWYESKKKKRREERELAKKAAAAERAKPLKLQAEPLPPFPSSQDGKTSDRSTEKTAQHSRPASLPIVVGRTHSAQMEPEPKKEQTRASTTIGQNNNDSIFEASGGKKKSGFASKLLMSSEERRKLKVKESILVIGTVKMNDNRTTIDRGSSDTMKPLVRL